MNLTVATGMLNALSAYSPKRLEGEFSEVGSPLLEIFYPSKNGS
jgi:hypothetical protein